jgi:putative DNA primase/helicase
MATRFCSVGKTVAVRTLIQSDRGIALSPDVLDHNPWVLNTPGGIVDLVTGALNPADPDELCTKSTSVPPDFNAEAPEWLRFLEEATGGDRDLVAYLKRLSGYTLTGSTREQHLTFIWGPGGNGKSVFLNTLMEILGDYGRTATMETFSASNSDRHSTDIAHLMGARMVAASETTAGRRWDEARVKKLTGGEPVAARFMRQDNVVFMPTFKLIFAGNHKPEIRDLDDAMKRRIHMVPFTVTPKVIDRELAAKLRAEAPAILAWMIEGCLEWQAIGLNPPEAVRVATEEYFAEEDAFGRWLADITDLEPGQFTELVQLYASWLEWAGRNGEYPGSVKRLSAALVARHYKKGKHSESRRIGFSGLALRPSTDDFTGAI